MSSASTSHASVPVASPGFAAASPGLVPAAARPAARPRLGTRAAFYLQASIILFFLAGSSAPTPLYPVYQAAWGFSPIAITAVFGVYALAVLAALLVAGSLSDHIGRRPVLLAAVLVQAVAMVMFAAADGLALLFAARVVQGLATGAAAGAVGAGLLDLDRARGTVANSVAPMLGTATGAILSGLMVQYLPAPTELVYLAFGAIFLAQAIGVAAMPETVARRPGALASLRPQLRMPSHVRGPVLLAVPTLVAAWALAGFYGSLGPTLMRRLLGSSSLLLGGFTLFLLAVSGAVTVFLLRSRSARAVLVFGTSALIAGVGATLLAIDRGWLSLFFAGAVVAGAGFGSAFQGAIRTVIPLAAAHERAGVLSVLYIVAYLAMGLPAVIGGVRLVSTGDILATAAEYSIAAMLLAAVALAGALSSGRRRGRSESARPR